MGNTLEVEPICGSPSERADMPVVSLFTSYHRDVNA